MDRTAFPLKTPWALPTGIVALIAVLAGFSGSYLAPLAMGRFDGGAIFHIHGALFFSWFVLLIAQSMLVRADRIRLHMGLGVLGVALAFAMIISAVTIEIAVARDAFAHERPERAAAGLLLTVSNATLFALMFGSAVAAAPWPGIHRRLMILAALSIVPIAVQRLFFAIGLGGIPGIAAGALVVDAAIVGLAVIDARRRGGLHPAFAIGLVVILTLQIGRVALLGTPIWTDAAEALIRVWPVRL